MNVRLRHVVSDLGVIAVLRTATGKLSLVLTVDVQTAVAVGFQLLASIAPVVMSYRAVDHLLALWVVGVGAIIRVDSLISSLGCYIFCR